MSTSNLNIRLIANRMQSPVLEVLVPSSMISTELACGQEFGTYPHDDVHAVVEARKKLSSGLQADVHPVVEARKKFSSSNETRRRRGRKEQFLSSRTPSNKGGVFSDSSCLENNLSSSSLHSTATTISCTTTNTTSSSCAGTFSTCHFNKEVEVEIETPRRVHFAPRQRVRVVHGISDLVDEPETLWYQEHELQAMYDKICKIVYKVRDEGYDRKPGQKKQVCIRGLERFISPDWLEEMRYQAFESVLGLQDLEDMATAQRYWDATQECVELAIELAKSDAVEAEKYYNKAN